MDAIEISPYQVQLLKERLEEGERREARGDRQNEGERREVAIVWSREPIKAKGLTDLHCPLCAEWIGAVNLAVHRGDTLVELVKFFVDLHLQGAHT